MSNIEDEGRKLFQSAENIRRSAMNIEALLECLFEMLERQKIDLGELERAKDEGADANGWVNMAWATSFQINEKASQRRIGQRGPSPKSKPCGTITFLVRLCGTEDVEEPKPAWPWLDQACLIVGWHSIKSAKNLEDFWFISNFEPFEGERFLRYNGDRTWSWHEEGIDYARFFVLPLFALNKEKDLLIHVLKPLENLFKGENAKDAFDPSTPALGPAKV